MTTTTSTHEARNGIGLSAFGNSDIPSGGEPRALTNAPADLWETFVDTATRRSSSPALIFHDRKVTFAEMLDLALRGAAFLLANGVRAGDIVALQLTKTTEAYALILGCLRLGAVYVCLDPKNPGQRTQRIAAAIGPKLVLTDVGSALSWPPPVKPTDQQRRITGSSPAYIMFTSGSTGEPKGAVIPHVGVLTLMQWSKGLIGNVEQECFTAINPLHFDNSVFDLYCGLVSGAALAPIETSESSNPADWLERVNSARATVFFAVPTLFLMLDKTGFLNPEALPYVTHFIFGGEGFPLEKLRKFYQHFKGSARLTNVYGPTETSCICSSLPIDDAVLAEAGSGFVSLGRMHSQFEYAVLDPDNAPCALGEPGELWIGGPCVGLGYFNQPEETKRHFQQDPRQTAYRSIFYRTGDLVREDAAGRLWFVGRADNQVKIAGHRIELEEIDFALQDHPDVHRAVTVVVGVGDRRELAAVFEAARPIASAELAARCRSVLAPYMQPHYFKQIAVLPTNANGKIDRLKTVELIVADRAQSHPSASHEDVETVLRQIWAEVLNLTTIPADANFFDLGGTSLMMMKAHVEIERRVGFAIPITQLFAYPKIEVLAQSIERRESDQTARDAQSRGSRQRELVATLRKGRPKASQ